jgi:hypothetical protein
MSGEKLIHLIIHIPRVHLNATKTREEKKKKKKKKKKKTICTKGCMLVSLEFYGHPLEKVLSPAEFLLLPIHPVKFDQFSFLKKERKIINLVTK